MLHAIKEVFFPASSSTNTTFQQEEEDVVIEETREVIETVTEGEEFTEDSSNLEVEGEILETEEKVKDSVVEEVIHPRRIEVVQPVIHRERVQTEIKKVL